jgi:TPR repeat protein
LGLNEESESVDYLFEEEGSSRGILPKLVLLAVLAAAGGLIFMQWRAGFPFLHAIQRSIHSAKVEPGSSLPEQNQDSPPAATETGSLNSEAASVKKPSGTAKDRVPDLAPLPKANTPPLEVQAPPASSGITTEPVVTSDRSGDRSKVAREDQDKDKPSQMLQRAQQYLEGTGGFAQNCDQGLVYLRAAAKSEAAAAAQMGVLYASGHCVQQDRVAAYRWLNSAHELQPGNSQIQANLNQLWAQMTSQERNQIIR